MGTHLISWWRALCAGADVEGYVAYGKHVCGVATDLSLRCVVNTSFGASEQVQCCSVDHVTM